MGLFKLKENKASVGKEILGGLITFVAMSYILPLNASILSDMGMNQSGVFAMTALVSFLVTMIMALVANYPIALSTGMGLNAYIVYTVAHNQSYPFTWPQAMILLTISGIIFFILSITPIRKWIVEAIPKPLQSIISASLGLFIAFVGLKNSGIVSSDPSTFITLGSFANPAVLIAIIGIFVTFILMICKNKTLSSLAIPIGVVLCALIGIVFTTISYYQNPDSLSSLLQDSNLPILPWIAAKGDPNIKFGLSGVKDVVFFGTLSDGYVKGTFGNDILAVLKNPMSYVAIFSLSFIKIFDSTATLVAVGNSTNVIDENGKMPNYSRAVIADATGTLICGPMGTSTITPFAESSVGIGAGARTGLASVITAVLFLASAFIYPVFSIFTAGSVTAPALMCVGGLIFISNIKQVSMKDLPLAVTTFASIIFTLLTYSISNGIGMGIIAYCISKLVSKKGKEVPVLLYVIAGLFIVSFALNGVVDLITKLNVPEDVVCK